MRDYAFLDVVLEMLHLRGLTPADLMIRQRQIAADAAPALVAEPAVESIRESTQPEDDIRARANENKNNNNKSLDSDSMDEWIDLSPEAVPSRWAEAIDRLRAALPRISAQTPQRLWQDFRAFNRNKGKSEIEYRALVGFLKRWQDRLSRYQAPAASAARKAAPAEAQSAPVSDARRELVEMSMGARHEDRGAHQTALERRWGVEVYRAKVREVCERYGVSTWSAQLAVHGPAVRAGLV